MLILYDHALTLQQEITLFWTRRFTVVTVLFFVNRYMTLCYGVLNVVSGFVPSKLVRLLFFSHAVSYASFHPGVYVPNITVLKSTEWSFHSCLVLTRLTQAVTVFLMLMFGGEYFTYCRCQGTCHSVDHHSVVVTQSTCVMGRFYTTTYLCVQPQPRSSWREHCEWH